MKENNFIPLPDVYISTLRSFGKEDSAVSYELFINVAKAIRTEGGRVLAVGGSVRDIVISQDPKDLDIEVYGIEAERLEKIASQFGTVSVVGKAFGILKVTTSTGLDLDLSLPREDSKIGEGHRGFSVKTNPFMTIQEAAKRRDFTFNSMAADPLTRELFDPYNGIGDIQNRIIRVTDPERFRGDPLRVMRAVQFAGRFECTTDPESVKIMQGMVSQLKELPKERLLEEWKKLLLKSPKPSVGLTLARELGIFDMLHPEFVPLVTTPQEYEYHPEGDVWTHSLMAVDSAVMISQRYILSPEQRWILMAAALCHDLGKATATVINENGRITSYGHDRAGVEPAQQFLSSIGVDNETYTKVPKIVEVHMWPHMAYGAFSQHGEKISDGAFRKLANRMFPATISELALLAQADHCGRGFYVSPDNPNELILPEHFEEGDWLRERAAQLRIETGKSADIIRGKDLIELGFKPGKEFGIIINLANQLRDEKEFTREQIQELLADFPTASEAINRLNFI